MSHETISSPEGAEETRLLIQELWREAERANRERINPRSQSLADALASLAHPRHIDAWSAIALRLITDPKSLTLKEPGINVVDEIFNLPKKTSSATPDFLPYLYLKYTDLIVIGDMLGPKAPLPTSLDGARPQTKITVREISYASQRDISQAIDITSRQLEELGLAHRRADPQELASARTDLAERIRTIASVPKLDIQIVGRVFYLTNPKSGKLAAFNILGIGLREYVNGTVIVSVLPRAFEQETSIDLPSAFLLRFNLDRVLKHLNQRFNVLGQVIRKEATRKK